RDRLEEMLGQACRGGQRFSRIEQHPEEKGWLASARRTLCGFDALREGAMVCRTDEERQKLREQLQRYIRDDYFLFPGIEEQDTAGGPPDPPVLLIPELSQLEGRMFRELFLAPGIGPWTTTRDELSAVLQAVSVGLHLVRLAN
ncbi:MAG: hypothetical protein ACKO8I_14350, partial [Cyanobacteriota bacterium]